MCLRVLVPLYLILRLANAESQHVAWVVSTTASPEEPSTFVTDNNEVDAQTSTTESNDVTTVQPAIIYDPGTKLLPVKKRPFVTQNQVSGSECSNCGVQVQALNIRSDIRFRYARTVVYSKIANPANTSNQATFSVMLPETAFISKFFIDVEGKKYEAYVKKKDEAEKQYQDALESGQTAAHIGVSTREADVFVVSVNVAPRSKVSFNLTYEELLSRRLSAYHHTINLIPDQVVKDMNVDVYIKEVRNITMLNVSTSDEGKNVHSGGDVLLVEYKSSTSAHVHFNPKEEDELERLKSGVQQLIIQYDVDRSTNPAGDVMLMDGYFVHYFAPEDVPPEPKHIVFVLDTSGSMWGRKLQQVQQAMFSILDSLRESDYFSIVQFSTNVLEWSTQPQEMVGLSKYKVTHPVNEMNIAKAKQFIKAMEASGGTNISGALRKALQLVAKQDYGSNSVEDVAEKRHLGQDAPQPMMIFLTDGIATVGELMTAKILAQVRAVNTEIRVAVFSLAFGDGANYRFLKKLSLQNNGFARKIYESADAALQLKSFYNEIASPLLANVSFTYLDSKVDKNSLTTNQFHSYYGGSEIIVAGKLNSLDTDLSDFEDLGAQVTAWSGGDHKDVLYKPHFNSEKAKHERRKQTNEAGTLERLWAYLTVRQLLDQHIAMGDDDKEISRPSVLLEEKFSQLEDSSPKSRALQLSLQYGFVTPLTSLVVVVPRNGSTNEVSEIIRDPIGNSLLEPAPFEESAPIQNKILPASFLPRPPALTVRPQTTQSTTTPTTAAEEIQVMDLTAMVSLTNYSLEDVSWLTDYTDAEDKLVVENRNSSYLVTGLIPTSEVPDTLEECVTPDGKQGSCWIMSACVQSNFVDDYPTFVRFFCQIGRLAGVCCPLEFISTEATVTTTEVPSTTSGIS